MTLTTPINSIVFFYLSLIIRRRKFWIFGEMSSVASWGVSWVTEHPKLISLCILTVIVLIVIGIWIWAHRFYVILCILKEMQKWRRADANKDAWFQGVESNIVVLHFKYFCAFYSTTYDRVSCDVLTNVLFFLYSFWFWLRTNIKRNNQTIQTRKSKSCLTRHTDMYRVDCLLHYFTVFSKMLCILNSCQRLKINVTGTAGRFR